MSALTRDYYRFGSLVRVYARLIIMITNAIKGQSGLVTSEFLDESHDILLDFFFPY